jgi:hypothetical protein
MLDLFDFGSVQIHFNCLNSNSKEDAAQGPSIIGNEYAEFTYPLANELQYPPGKYPLLIIIIPDNAQYLYDLEQDWWFNAELHQVLWVTVE